MRSALIAGVSGQDGLYLSELLLANGYKVFGLVHSADPKRELQLTTEVPGLQLIHGDLTDTSSLFRALEIATPDEVYNLGAKSHVAFSWEQAQQTAQVTAIGVLNLLEAIRVSYSDAQGRPRFYQASSSEMFGKAQETPQRETTLLWPRSPYGVAKVFGHHMTINYRESYGFHASSGILFNHESPRRGPEFVTRKVTQSVARIATGKQETIVMGNLEAMRDWGFAGDYVKAMWLMLQQDLADDYVIATGKTHSVRDLVSLAFSVAGISNWEDYLSSSDDLLRPADISSLVGDPSKAKLSLGWVPETSFEELVTMMVEHDLRLESQT
ncbi:MAG: GDP-mannose 4,6-dehydratase [Candidatus Nanopelagicales bacterium]|nr:GDP-mannose 4,6-dehydratase [Candidatus Nanopelagicales bacterium]